MATAGISEISPTPGRVLPLNTRPLQSDGQCVVYWMQNSLRFADNPALDTAAAVAHALDLPLLVWFGLSDRIPFVAERSARFLVDGLAVLEEEAAQRPFAWQVRRAGTPGSIVRALRALQPAAVITDSSHLRFGRARRAAVADELPVACAAVDADVVVPVWQFDKAQIGARTLRPRLWRELEHFRDDGLQRLPDPRPWEKQPDVGVSLVDPGLRAKLALRMATEPDVPTGGAPPAGERAARGALQQFVNSRLEGYADARRDAAGDRSARLSIYLRYGMLSPRQVLRAVEATDAPTSDRETFLDELVVRRELSSNYTWHEPHYATFDGLPNWARATLELHAHDPRPGGFTEAQMETGDTGDLLYDTAMLELRHRGTIHNFARMYWGKQILAWHPDPVRARVFAQELNDRYGLDGRSANGYANVAWCFGLHDRPWPEREVFGTVRSMTFASSSRKIDLAGYAARIKRVINGEQADSDAPSGDEAS